jgi:hypothetical protein
MARELTYSVVQVDTGKKVKPHSILRTDHPSARPGMWRLERHVCRKGDHMVHVSRSHNHMGRVHREFHPSIFGLTIEVDVVWYRDVRHAAHWCWVRGGDWLMAGVVALVPLSFFETYHWGSWVAELFGKH